jgi:hypothetical protein
MGTPPASGSLDQIRNVQRKTRFGGVEAVRPSAGRHKLFSEKLNVMLCGVDSFQRVAQQADCLGVRLIEQARREQLDVLAKTRAALITWPAASVT